MDKNRWKKISRIIDAALSVPAKSRFSYVQTFCEGDDSLLEEVYDLLRSLESGTDSGILDSHLQKNQALLDEAYNKEGSAISPQSEPGDTIGAWKLIQLLGRGGMGTVYKVKRENSAIEQSGALKILHRHLNTPEHLHRFHQEQQILAGLQHPNITTLIEGGVNKSGLPYLVMEFIEGEPLLKYCDKHRLCIDDRIRLFIKVCEAVHYAHKKLVVHRDLKPENILVTDEGNIKVLDFGIAKLLDPGLYHLPDKQTREGLRLMSLEYASPEQINGEAVTISTDIYALGILLYELLSGIHPLEPEGKTYRETVQQILKEEFVAPSQKVRHFLEPDALAEISSRRSVHPTELIKKLTGDIDAIIRKSVRKEPEHRYDSVGHLVDDLNRYQQTKPVSARRGSLRYRTYKFIKRQKGVLVSALFFAILLTGFGFYHLSQITQQRDLARLEAEKANRIKDFTTTLFAAGNPYYDANTDGTVTASQLLEAGLLNIETELTGEPEVYAEMHSVIGKALMELGEYERSRSSLEKSLDLSIELYGEVHPAVASNLALLGRLNGIQGNIEPAVEWVEKALAVNQNFSNENPEAVAQNYADLGKIYAYGMEYEKAVEFYQQSLDIYEKIDQRNSLNSILTRSNLAGVQIQLGLLEEAANNEAEVIDNLTNVYGESHLTVANSYSSLARIHLMQSNFPESEKYARQTLELKTKLFGADHPGIINSYSFLGALLHRQGKYEEAATAHHETIRIFTINELTDSLSLSSYLNNLAVTKTALAQPDSSAGLHREVLRIRTRFLEPDHSSITVSMYNLADAYYAMNELEQAHDLFEQVVERDKRAFGDNHPEVAIDLMKLAAVTRDLQNFEQAERLFSEAGQIFADHFAPSHHRTGEFYMEYGLLKMMLEEHENADRFLHKSLGIFSENYSEDHERVIAVKKYIAAIPD
jgi:eukaryotic-like serine/threonine-protein kinase